jgi:ABC-type transporter Mla maintaining outer membrane lipid asymmetry permease subunit MlaE
MASGRPVAENDRVPMAASHILRLVGATFVEVGALRRRAVRDALAEVFVQGLRRAAVAVVVIAALLGLILFRYVLPLIPLFGSQPTELATMFLFAVQHLGDVVGGMLVIGQAGLLCTWELVQARDRRHFAAAVATGIDPLVYFVMPRVWGVALLFVFVQMVFKVLTVLSGVYLVAWLDGRFFGPELGEVIARHGDTILAGYGLNTALGLALAAICAAPALEPTRRDALRAPPIARVFLQCLTLLFVAKLVHVALLL